MYLSVSDPEYLRKLLNHSNAMNKGFTYKFLEWKRSLLTADGKFVTRTCFIIVVLR